MKPRLAAGLAIAALVLAACGEESEPAESPARDFRATADRLCAEAGRDYDAVVAALPPFERIVAPDVTEPVMRKVAAAAPRLAEVERALERRLRALAPPARLAERWDRALDTLGHRAVAALEIGAAAKAGDRAAYLSGFERFERAGAVSSRALAREGFEVCAAG